MGEGSRAWKKSGTKEGGFWWGGKSVKSIFRDIIILALKI